MLGLDASSFNVGLKRASSQTKVFSREFNSHLKSMIVGAFGVAAIEEAIRRSVEYASKIRDTASANNISTDAVQEFGFAAKQTGAKMEDFATAMKKIAVARQEALGKPGDEMATRFERLGVSIADLKTMRLEDLLLKIGDAFKASLKPQEIMVDGIKLMGRNATAVFPAMREGLRELMEEAKAAGNVIDESTIESLARLGDQFEILKGRALAGFAEGLATIVEKIGQFIVGMEMLIAKLGAASTIASNKPKSAARFILEKITLGGIVDKKLGGQFGDMLFGTDSDTAGFSAEITAAMAKAESEIAMRELERERLVKLRAARRKEGRDLPLNLTATTKAVKEMSLDSLSKIGGFSQGANAILRSLNERIADATESTAQSVDRIVRIEEEGGY